MTKYTVVVEGKQYRIDVAKTENQEHFAIKMDDKPHKLELKDKFEYDTPIQIRLDEKIFIIQVTKKDKQALFQIKVKDIPINAEVKPHLINSLPQPATASAPAALIAVKPATGKTVNEGAVAAPMAGKIVSIRVKKGEAVKAGAVVCILEAMKMENEIVAQKDGLVKEIFVSMGAGVNKGDPLFVVEPSKD